MRSRARNNRCRLCSHCKGEDAVEQPDAPLPELGIGMEHHLRVRVSFKAVSFFFQGMAHLRRVVNLPIVHNGVFLPGKRKLHGLLAARRVDDGEPRMEQGAAFLPERPLSVRPPPMHGIEHFFHFFAGNRQIHKARNGTHGITTSIPFGSICSCAGSGHSLPSAVEKHHIPLFRRIDFHSSHILVWGEE